MSFLSGLNNEFDCYAKSSIENNIDLRWRRGQGGVALFWNKRKISAQKIKTDSDRMVALRITLKNNISIKLVVCCVYFPSTNSEIARFKDTLDLLESFCLQYSNKNESIVVLGDFNAHLCDSRSGQHENTRGKLLQRMFNKFNMLAINSKDCCSGAKYTYVSSVSSTVVDYVFVQHAMLKYVKTAKIGEDHPDNTSYHLPIFISFDFPLAYVANEEANSTNVKLKETIVWKECSVNQLEAYASRLNNCIAELMDFAESVMPKASLDNFVNGLSDIIIDSAHKLPKLKYKNHIKPYWNAKLKKLSKESKAAWHVWVAAGKPRGFRFEAYRRYKQSKARFRRELRYLVKQYEQREFERIAEKEDLDQIQFWKYINRRKGKAKIVNDYALRLNGQIVNDSKEVASCWANYYEKLFSPFQSDCFDETFHEEVNTAVNRIKTEACANRDDIFDIPISIEEVNVVINSLPNGKAPGFDYITNEHVKFGGFKLREALVYIFNRIVIEEHIPRSFKLAIKIPIPKDCKEDMSFDNSRGISLLTTFNKILENITLQRLNKKYSGCIEGLQGAYQKQQSALTSALIIDEVINRCLEDGDKIYDCYVDIAKAFDRMWINGMLYKLYFNIGITGKTWRLIYNWYHDMEEYVCIDGSNSRTYKLHQGTLQGGVLSPWIFLIFINDLITELKDTKAGVTINNLEMGSPMFADDLTLLARLKWGLDLMLEVVNNFGNRWRLVFSNKKAVILTFGESSKKNVQLRSKRKWDQFVFENVQHGRA